MSRGRTRQISEDDEIEMSEGRPEPVAPYSRLGDWVMLALQAKKIRHPAVSLYWALFAHLNANRDKKGDRKVWPTQKTLALMLNYSEGKKLKPYLDELESIGAIEVKTERVPGGGYRLKCSYVIHKSPPPGYDGLESIQDFYSALKAEQEAERAAKEAAQQALKSPAREDLAGAVGVAKESSSDGFPAATREDSPWAEMSPRPWAEMSPRTVGRNEPINKTKKQDEGNKIGGADRRPPEPPADQTAGRVDHVVTSKTELVSNQQTACAKTVVAQRETIEIQQESAGQWGKSEMQTLTDPDQSITVEPAPVAPGGDAPVLTPSVAVDATESVNDTGVTLWPVEPPVIESGAVSRSCAAPSVQAARGRPSLRALKAQFDAEKSTAQEL